LNEKEYPKDCRIITLGQTQTVRCGCFKKYAPAEQRLKELKKEYTKALVAMSYTHRFADINSTTEKVAKNNVMQEDDLSLDNIEDDNTSFDMSKYTLTNDDLSSSKNGPSLNEAIEMLKEQNLEIKAAKIDLEAS
jgi:hypothetical protein